MDSQPRYRNAMLASAIRRVTAQLLSTEAAAVSIPRVAEFDLTDETYRRNVLQLHSNDDALSPMHISDYNEQRLEFQQKKFRTEAKQFATRLKVFEYLGFITNGVAIVMILVKEEVWVASMIVLISIFAAVVAVGQYEDRLLRTNSAIVTLNEILCGWNTLDEEDQIKQELLDRAIARSEGVIMAAALGEDASSANSS